MSDPSGAPDHKRDGDGAVGNDRTIEEALRQLGALAPPGGYALVAGAADWRRGGMSAPVPASLLPVLAAPHLTDLAAADLANHETYEAALRWATRDINPTAALLRRNETDSCTLSDYALDLFSRHDEPIPKATWSVLLENATPRDLVGVGYTAEVVYGLSEVALQAWRNAADSGDADSAPAAAGSLGVLLGRQGDVEGARAAFEQAINSGHADYAPAAAGWLGDLLRRQGDVEGARAAFEQAINSGHPDHAPAAAGSLGELLRQQGDPEGARAAFEQAISSGHADLAPAAAVELGKLLWEADAEGARAAFEQAISSGHPDHAPAAAGSLGELLRQQGDPEGARAAFEQAISSGHADLAPAAAVELGKLLWEADAEGARAAFEQAISSGHPDLAPAAAVELGKLLWEADAEGARAAFEQAISSGHPDHAPRAAAWLGVLLQQQGDPEGARAAFEQAISSGHPDHAPAAAGSLGELLWQQGDVEGARAAFEQVISSGHADLAPAAAIRLGELLWQQRDVPGARAAFEQAISSGHPEAAEEARERLGELPPEDYLRNVRRAARSARERIASSGSIRLKFEPLTALIEALAHLEAGAAAVAGARLGDVIRRNRHADDNRTAEIVAEAGVWWLACQLCQPPINVDEINSFLLELVDRGDLRERSNSALLCLSFASESLTYPTMHLEDQWRSNLEWELTQSREAERIRANAEQWTQYGYERAAESAHLAARVIANRIVNGVPLMLWLRSFSAEARSSPMRQEWSPGGQEGWTVRGWDSQADALESVLVRLNEDLPFVTAALPFVTPENLTSSDAPIIPRIRLRNERWMYAVSSLIDVCDGIVVLVDNRRSPSLLTELRCIHEAGAVGKTVALIPQDSPGQSDTLDLFSQFASQSAEDNDSQYEEMGQLLESIPTIPSSEDYASAAVAVRAAFGERWGFLEDLRSIPWQDRVRIRMAPEK